MAQYRVATPRSISGVLRNMADQCESEAGMYATVYAEEINRLLNSLLEDDFFGTEGQSDPRGDHRD